MSEDETHKAGNNRCVEHPELAERKKRQTYYIRMDLIRKVKEYAYWERKGISEVVNVALEEFFRRQHSQ